MEGGSDEDSGCFESLGGVSPTPLYLDHRPLAAVPSRSILHASRGPGSTETVNPAHGYDIATHHQFPPRRTSVVHDASSAYPGSRPTMKTWDWPRPPVNYSQSTQDTSTAQVKTGEKEERETPRDDTLYIHHDGSTAGPRPVRWRGGLSCSMTLYWRVNELRHLGIFALLLFGISLLLLEARRGMSGSRDGLIDEMEPTLPGISKSDPGSPRVPGQCTTWPVRVKTSYRSGVHKTSVALQRFAPPGGWKKPDGIAIKALVFYGRKRTVDFLDCYLQQNLAVNGGYLDEVWFMVHTAIEEDLAYLHQLIDQRPHYKVVMPGECQGSNYACMWSPVVEDNTIYVKIDDDIVSENPFERPSGWPEEPWRGIAVLTCSPADLYPS